ncbi:WD40-repeat-containing domain protein [Cunninghamella echinulata]|nr:WD40-repeat-containing domain protein [Cunninghamella echinulata]
MKSASSSTKTPKNNNNNNNAPTKPSKQIDTPISRPMFRRSVSAHSILDVIGKDWLKTPRPTRISTTRHYDDRFIPNRDNMDLASSQFNLANNKPKEYLDHDTLEYQERVAKACGLNPRKRILSFHSEQPPEKKLQDERLRHKLEPSPFLPTEILSRKIDHDQPTRQIIKAPEKILDAPYMTDDYYLNLLDWSSQNIVAVALHKYIYLWNADNGVTRSLKYDGEEPITALSWSADGNYLSLGLGTGVVQVWDVEANSRLRLLKGRNTRIDSLSWNKHLVSSGGRDGGIWHHDVRLANHKTAELEGHESEVCGLKWRPDGMLLASGGNDNTVHVWDIRTRVPKFTKRTHFGAIKALAWCPWNNHVLATGGGREDKNIHFWNVSTTTRVHSVSTGSQVTSLHWSKHYKEIVSTHGYPNNQITLWSYPKLKRIIDIPAHESRILHSALSPDGQVLATVAADENLKFFRVFDNDGNNEFLRSPEETEKSEWLKRTTSLR